MEQIIVGSILGISFIDDMSTKKVHNFLILLFFAVSVCFFFLFSHWQISQLQSFLLCQAICLPLVYLRILGAGDWKLFSVISLFLNPVLFVDLFVLSLFWNAIAGSIRYFLFKAQKNTNLSFQEKMKFPYTFGILLAWASLEFIFGGAVPW